MNVKILHGKGNHLILDAFSDSELDNVKFIKNFLVELTEKISMTPISKPLVINHKGNKESENGVTGTIILAESNITIHTYPNKKWFCLDVYSCNEFDKDIVLDYLKDKFKMKNYKLKLLRRGFYERSETN